MQAEKRYDAFLSHNSQDKPAVEEIAHRLRDQGITVWLDTWNLIPGETWQEDIEEALDESHCCVVFLGPNGIGSWQNEEIRAALDERVSHKGLRVVPVLLPGARRPEKESKIPKFLRRLTWIQYSRSIRDEEAQHRLVCGIKGIAPGPGTSLATTDVCPFRGLEVFREEDARFFFGRESAVQKLADHLTRHRFLVVIGPSGSGKSSVVQAGLLPELKKAYPPADGARGRDTSLCISLFTPKARPLEELASVLRGLQAEAGNAENVEDIITRLSKNEKRSALRCAGDM